MEELLQREANKEILRYAVCRQIFCHCGNILDVRSAVLVTGERSAICCGKCWTKTVARFTTQYGADKVADVMTTMDILDGSVIFDKRGE